MSTDFERDDVGLWQVTVARATPTCHTRETPAPTTLAALLPGVAIVDWDAFMAPAAALAGRQIWLNPDTWPAYRDLIRAVVTSMTHVPVVLLGVGTPDELHDWPIDSWVLLDCADSERRERLTRSGRLDAFQAAA